MATVIRWNGTDLPEELRGLPAGRYVVEPLDDVPLVALEEDAGLELALDALEHGGGLDEAEARRLVVATVRP